MSEKAEYTLYCISGSPDGEVAMKLLRTAGIRYHEVVMSDEGLAADILGAACPREFPTLQVDIPLVGGDRYFGLESIEDHMALALKEAGMGEEYLRGKSPLEIISEKRCFLICPVRGVSALDRSRQAAYVARLEGYGWTVHWPPRDTPQDDPSGGWNISLVNRNAIKNADKVFVVWNGKSYGSHFDLGMAFAFQKPIEVLERPYPPLSMVKKSYGKMMSRWELLLE